jgi:hypothetical protein
MPLFFHRFPLLKIKRDKIKYSYCACEVNRYLILEFLSLFSVFLEKYFFYSFAAVIEKKVEKSVKEMKEKSR